MFNCMYADDISLCFKSKDVSLLNGVVNRDLEDFDSWLKGNKLSLNVVKTQSMLRLKHFLGIAAEL